MDERLVFPLPSNTPRTYIMLSTPHISSYRWLVDVGAMIEPLAVAWHAINRSAFKEGANVLVIGSGPVRRS